MFISPGCQHAAAFAGWHNRRAVNRAAGQTDPAIIPNAKTLHEQRVNCVDCKRPDRLQDIGDCRGSGTGISVVVSNVWKEAGDARTHWLLHENVAMITVPADCSKDDRNPPHAELPAGQNPRRVVVYATDGDVTGEVNAALNGFLKAKCESANLGCRDTLALQILGKRQGLVLTEIVFIEPLAVEVAGFNDVVIDERDAADPLTNKRWGDL